VGAGLRWLTARRWRLVAGALLILAIAARAALPFALTWVVESRGTGILGRVVRVADIDLGLLTGDVRIEGLSIGPIFAGREPPVSDADEEAHLRVERLTLNWSWLALLRGEARLQDVAVVGPKVLLVRMPDGEMVPLRRPRPEAATAAEPDDAGSGDPWPVRVDDLLVSDVGLIFVNRAIPGRAPLQFEMKELALTGLALDGDDVTLGRIGMDAPRLRVAHDIDLAPFVGGGGPPPEAATGTESAGPEPAEEDAAATAVETIAEAADDALEDAPPEAAPARTLTLADVSLERAGFTVLTEDGGKIETWISASAQNVSLDEPFPLDLAFELEGGILAIRGDAGAKPVTFDGTVAWSDLPLERIAAIAGDRLPLRIGSGASSGELAVQARIATTPEGGPSRIDVSGRAGVKGFSASRGGDALHLAWSDLEVELASLALRPDGDAGRAVPPRIEIAAVRLHEPALAAILRTADPPAPEEAEPAPTDLEESAAEAEPAATSPEPRIRIAHLAVTGGEIDFADESVSPAHRSRLRDLTVEGRDLRFPEREAAQLRIAAEGPGDGSIRFDAATPDGDGTIALDVADLGLPAFSPYSADAVGYWVERGRATVAARARVRDAGYEIDTDVSLDDLDVTEVTAGSFEKQFGLSLDLALALLRDPFGRISLPVSARVASGETDIAVERIVLSALRHALVGALTSPLKGVGVVLGAATGGGDEPTGLRIEPLAVAPGATSPLADEFDRVAGMAKALAGRPGLGLELRGRSGVEDDPALAERMLTEMVVADAELPPVDAGLLQKRRLRSALEDRAHGRPGDLGPEDAEALARWIDAVEVPPIRRDELANERATAVRDALLESHAASSDRLRVGDPLTGPPAVVIQLAPVGR
jgi:hypothetical protein